MLEFRRDPIPPEWTDENLPAVVAAISEGYCPAHMTSLSPIDSTCGGCGRARWQLVSTSGTIPTSQVIPPPWVTDGRTVRVNRYL